MWVLVMTSLDLLRRAAGLDGPGPCERGFRALAARPWLARAVRFAVIAQAFNANTLMRGALLRGEGG
jgi:hypothetical protein